MTKKHFEALAASFKESRPDPDSSFQANVAHNQWEMNARLVSDVCARFNPNFDRTRFLKACGVEEAK